MKKIGRGEIYRDFFIVINEGGDVFRQARIKGSGTTG